MKKREQVTTEADVWYCDICNKIILDRTQYNRERFELIKGLMSTESFDAHSKCVNDVVREALKPFIKK